MCTVLQQFDCTKHAPLITYQLFYLSFVNLASKSSFVNKPLEDLLADSVDTVQ